MVKSKLIKFCLAIKNGFKVNANEMMQLLRRSYKLKLDVDPVMSGYLKVQTILLRRKIVYICFCPAPKI